MTGNSFGSRATLTAGQNSVENDFLDTLPPPDDQCIPGCFNSVDMWLLFDRSRQAVYDANGGVGAIFILERGVVDRQRRDGAR